MNILYTAETEGLAELGTELQELKELSQPDVLLDIVKGWIPDLTSLGIKLLIALVIFLVGRKIIGLILRMAKHSFERAGMEISVMKFLNSLIGFCLNALLIFIIAGQMLSLIHI